MRWRYFDERNSREAASHAEILQKMDSWWNAFSARTHALENLIHGREHWDLPEWMAQHLQVVEPNLMWEFGPALHGAGHRLVITPESNTHLRVMVQTLLERAPKLPGWEFYPYRPPASLQWAIQTAKARSHRDLHNISFSVTVAQHNRIDLRYCSPATASPDDKEALNGAFVATETLLGEEILDQWVGRIEVAPPPKRSGLARFLGHSRKSEPLVQPLDRLKPVVDALITSIIEQRPDQPLYAIDSDSLSSPGKPIGAVFKCEPPIADDYPQWQDLFVASAADQGLWLALHTSSPFYSARYSRHGEQFCYLKLDGSEALQKEEFPDRASIEMALDESLIPARAGCVISGGTGRRYSYIDLALADVDAAIPLIISRLRAGNISNRTWLLFFDAPFSHEWIGIYDNTPAPPGMVQ